MKKTALAAAFALVFTAAAVVAQDVPNMKEGLWKLHMVTTSTGAKPEESSYSLCRNHAYDLKAHDLMKKTGCTVNEGSTIGGKRTFSGVCKVGSTTISSKSTLTSSGDTSFHSETTTTYSPAMNGMSQSTSTQDQTYIGSCPAGMNPGDIISSNGQVRHRSQ
jgi:hypothetical protein